MTSVLVQFRHVRAANLCARGTRAWFIQHGLSWSEFLATGIPASVFEATGDPLALRAVAAAREEAGHGQG